VRVRRVRVRVKKIGKDWGREERLEVSSMPSPRPHVTFIEYFVSTRIDRSKRHEWVRGWVSRCNREPFFFLERT